MYLCAKFSKMKKLKEKQDEILSKAREISRLINDLERMLYEEMEIELYDPDEAENTQPDNKAN